MRASINRISAIVPVILSLLAFAVVILAVATGWGQAPGDEGAAAHIFQILITLQPPLILAYAVTADWQRWRRPLGRMALQLAAIILALSPVAYFRL